MTHSPLPDTVDTTWLQSHLDDPDLVIVDATNHLTVPANGHVTIESGEATFGPEHIPGAVFANLLTDFAEAGAEGAWTVPSPEQFAEKAGALGIGAGVKVVVYDQHETNWATRFWWHLRLEGFDDVAVLDGGLNAWRAAGLPVTSHLTVPTPRVFEATRRPELLKSAQEVLAAINDDSTVIVNVLPEEMYRGDFEAFARNGHIPGSINLPVAQVFDAATGRFKTADELRAVLDEAGLLDPDKQVITYCGGGIAATGLAMALATAGRPDVAVYDGSMTEWAADPDLPLVTGDAPR